MLPDSYRPVSQQEECAGSARKAATGKKDDAAVSSSPPHSAAYSLILSPHSTRSASPPRHPFTSLPAADSSSSNPHHEDDTPWPREVDTTNASSALYGNKNVRYTILYNLLDGACVSVWSALLLPLLIGRRDDAASVGLCTTIGGILQILGATLAARVAQPHRRQRVIRAAALCGLVSVCVFLAGLPYTRVLYVAQGLWGLYVGLASTATEALFADSVASGQRTGIYNTKWIVQTLCYVVGYVFALCMLVTQGNVWSLTSITRVMTVGLCCQPIAFLVLYFLRDAYAIDSSDEGGEENNIYEESEGRALALTPSVSRRSTEHNIALPSTQIVTESRRKHHNAAPVSFLVAVPETHDESSTVKSHEQGKSHTVHEAALPVADDELIAEVPPTAHEQETFLSHHPAATINNAAASSSQSTTQTLLHSSTTTSSHSSSVSPFGLLFTWRAVPYVVCAVDLLMAIGSGMVLQYFPLFFVESCHFTPVIVYVTYLISTGTTALVASAVRYIADHYTGRLPIVLVTRALGAMALLLLAHVRPTSSSNDNNSGAVSESISWWPAMLFVVRNSCMNAVLGLTRSVIMDAVQPASRAKWSAFESFSSFTWAGSATIGGYIAEAKGYQYTFAVTAILHLCATALLLPAAVGAASFEAAARRLAQSTT